MFAIVRYFFCLARKEESKVEREQETRANAANFVALGLSREQFRKTLDLSLEDP